jgi:hypothetical protein
MKLIYGVVGDLWVNFWLLDFFCGTQKKKNNNNNNGNNNNKP